METAVGPAVAAVIATEAAAAAVVAGAPAEAGAAGGAEASPPPQSGGGGEPPRFGGGGIGGASTSTSSSLRASRSVDGLAWSREGAAQLLGVAGPVERAAADAAAAGGVNGHPAALWGRPRADGTNPGG